MIIKKDICYANNTNQLNMLDIYRAEGKVNTIVIYVHGGGIEGGSKEDIMPELNKMTEQGYAIVYPNYRLYPDAQYPQFIEDIAQAVAWVKNNSDMFDNCDNIFIGGSSAGAYISMMLYFDNTYLAKYGLSSKDFSGFIFDAGQPTAHYNVLRERHIDTRRVIVDSSAPLYHIEEYNGQPPVLVVVAENDMTNRYEQNMLLMSTMRHFNYPSKNIHFKMMKGCTHCSYNGYKEFAELIVHFIESCNTTTKE